MPLADYFLYFSLFSSLFFEVVLLITYFEIREKIRFENDGLGKSPLNFPTVSIIVPCFNEALTVSKTIHSLLHLDYPQDKLSIVVVNDGSTDNTLEVLKEFNGNPQINIFTKENEGSKFAALNFALERISTDLVGCLDADSFVDSEALRRMIPYFDDAETMAVTPSIKVFEPKSVLQHVQKIEYNWGIFLRHMLAEMNALYVTPGPFSIFRTKIFAEIGGYRHAHHTEDMEMALRLHKNGYKITNSHGAYVYTVTPAQFPALYKQRVRWSYGFLNNAIDYKDMLFNKKYGNIGIFVLPIAIFSMFSTIYAMSNMIWNTFNKLGEVATRVSAVGFGFGVPSFTFDWFFINTGISSFIASTVLLVTFFLLYLSLKVSEGKARPSKALFYYLTIYMFIVPLWLARSIFNTIFRKKSTWR